MKSEEYRERSKSGMYPGYNVGVRFIEVPEDLYRSLLLQGIKNPLPVEAFFDTPGGDMTKQPADTPPAAEKAVADPFENLVPGRIVHYWPAPYEEKNCAPGPWPAIVTKVGDLGKVTLNVQMPVPAPVGTDPVHRMVDVVYSPDHAPRTWSWMFEGQAGRYKPDRSAS